MIAKISKNAKDFFMLNPSLVKQTLALADLTGGTKTLQVFHQGGDSLCDVAHVQMTSFVNRGAMACAAKSIARSIARDRTGKARGQLQYRVRKKGDRNARRAVQRMGWIGKTGG